MSVVKSRIGWIARAILGDYQLYRTYRLDRPVPPAIPEDGRTFIELGENEPAQIRSHSDPKVQESAGFASSGIAGFGIL